jgi:peptide/nickel transport system ATP-binding protein
VTARQPLLAVEGLGVRFATARGVLTALDGVTFRLDHGECLGIVGESGSGKSALCRGVMRLTPATALVEGRVRFDGVDLTRLPERRMRTVRGSRLALVLQNPMTALNPVVRIGRQITESLELDRKAARTRAVELLRQVGIPDPVRQLRRYPHELSGGMRQRVCISIAVSRTPDLLFADEPTTGLDGPVQRRILDLLTVLRHRHGMAMVLVSHDIAVVAGRTEQVMVMYGGRVVETGPTRHVLTNPRHPYTAAMLASVPRVETPGHTRLVELPGPPADPVNPPPGCRFAPRCRYARPRCLSEDPVIRPGSSRAAACFYPVGTPAGARALADNRDAGWTAAGLALPVDGWGA